MILPGLRIPAFLGWISGVFFVSRPWGNIRFISYCHPYTLYALGINAIFCVLWADFYKGTMSKAEYENQPLTIKIFLTSFTIGIHIFNAYVRLIFFAMARRISRMLVSIHELMGPVKPRDLKCIWALFHKIFWVILVFYVFNAFVMVMYFCFATSNEDAEHEMRGKWIFYPSYPRPWWYFVIFFLFGTLPFALCIYFTYAFIFITTFCILCTFDQFCLTLHEIGHRKINPTNNKLNLFSMSDNDTNGKLDTYSVTLETELMSLHQHHRHEDETTADEPSQIISLCPGLKAELFERFEKVKSLFEAYDSIVGPLLLGMIVRNVIIVINEGSAVVMNVAPLGNRLDTQQGCSILNMIGDLIQFVILELGSWTYRRMNKWKTDLEKMIILMPTSFEKDHLSDVVHQVCKWKWQMSASGFFYINRQLMSGIVATMLSYIVILFQLRLSETSGNDSSGETQPASCLCSENSTGLLLPI